MKLKRLFLENFRNYPSLDLSCEDIEQVAIIGANAQGKSNLLEALYLLAFATSFRTSKLTELIKWQAEKGRCSAIFESENKGTFHLQFTIQNDSKRHIQVNHSFIKKLSDFIGQIHLVLFSSRDLQMVNGSPNHRRTFLNLLLVQLYPKYFEQLQTYNKILKQRNAVLKTCQKSKTEALLLQLDVWDQKLAHIAVYLFKKRNEVIVALNQEIQQIHPQISSFNEELKLVYEPSISMDDVSFDEFEVKIIREWKRKRGLHIQRGQTLSGPHRDDLSFLINSRPLKKFWFSRTN